LAGTKEVSSLAERVVSAVNLDKPIVGKKSVSGRNDGTMRTVIDAGEFGTFSTDEPVPHGGTGTAPSPLQTVVGSLCGCEGVTFNRTAEELEFAYEGIEFNASYTIDIRGRMGNRAVRPHFQTVRLEARVFTDESEERLREVVEETEARCPVYNLISDAGVRIETLWIREEID
jgi:uncharacterized OsmC-like protein